MKNKSWFPWLWVPTLYFAESLPNAIVADLSKFMYTNLGMSATQLGLITGAMYLPWTLKPFWSPYVDLYKTKRWWTVLMQLIMAGAFFGLAFSVRAENYILWTSVCFWLIAFVSATHDIAADGFYLLGLDERNQAAFTGIRATAYRLGMLFVGSVLLIEAGLWLKGIEVVMDKQGVWSLIMMSIGGLFLILGLYHAFMLPKPEADVAAPAQNFLVGYVETFTTFFKKPGIWAALAFMLLFRFAEAQLLGMMAPFLTGAKEAGGLALSLDQIGVVKGFWGFIGIICGGILAGWLVAQFGLRKWYWILIFVMHLPNLAFLYLATTQTNNMAIISASLFIEQFGYGFGFTAYMLYLMYFSRGNHQTAHYAMCTGFMALSLMLPQMMAGYIKDALGFVGFYGYIMVATIPSFIVAWLAWKNKDFIDHFKGKNAA